MLHFTHFNSGPVGMNMREIDWAIVGVFLLGIALIALITRTYMRSVADFLAANRCAGRYIIAMAEGMSGLGVISIVASWEQFYQGGFGVQYWSTMLTPIGMILALTGWVIYRFRETRALTMAQFFEMRYSRRFRIFAGVLAWGSGVINYGVFPAVTARFFIYFCGLPVYEWEFLGLNLNLTLAVVMAVLLSLALTVTLLGGQIAVMVTDFLQWMILIVVFLGLIGFLFWTFGWSEIIAGLQLAPEGQSRIHPFKQASLPDFNPLYYFMMAFLTIYGYMIWQGSQGYNASAKSPHEAKMGRIIGYWRATIFLMVMMMVPICAFGTMHLDAYAETAASVQETLQTLPTEQLQTQMRSSIVLAELLPIGLMGLVCAVMLAATISTDDTYLHSWGSIFVQDVLLPLRGRSYEPTQHLRVLRRSIIGVAVFAWTFSLLFPLDEYILMYFMITGAIYMGGAGSAVIGGLYWRRGTAAGAWAGMITGSVLSVSGILVRNLFWPNIERLRAAWPEWEWLQRLPSECPLNGVEMATGAALASVACYVIFSLLSRNPGIDMDKLLHRGRYDVEDEHRKTGLSRGWVLKALGITKEFTRGDLCIYLMQIGWIGLWFGLFIVLLVWNQISLWPDSWWINYWLFVVIVMVIATVATVIWFLIGGTRDLIDLLRKLRTKVRDLTDDGTVSQQARINIPEHSEP